MSDNTQNDSEGVAGSGDGPLPPPPTMTPAEAFIAAQTEVLRQILQTQQQIAQKLQQPVHNQGHIQDGPNAVLSYE
jgi:hypothetical protein